MCNLISVYLRWTVRLFTRIVPFIVTIGVFLYFKVYLTIVINDAKIKYLHNKLASYKLKWKMYKLNTYGVKDVISMYIFGTWKMWRKVEPR